MDGAKEDLMDMFRVHKLEEIQVKFSPIKRICWKRKQKNISIYSWMYQNTLSHQICHAMLFVENRFVLFCFVTIARTYLKIKFSTYSFFHSEALLILVVILVSRYH